MQTRVSMPMCASGTFCLFSSVYFVLFPCAYFWFFSLHCTLFYDHSLDVCLLFCKKRQRGCRSGCEKGGEKESLSEDAEVRTEDVGDCLPPNGRSPGD